MIADKNLHSKLTDRPVIDRQPPENETYGYSNFVIDDKVAGEVGAYKVGVVAAEPVSDDASAIYDDWIAAGHHASMEYLERYADIRRDPRLLLPGARSIIAFAFNYNHPVPVGIPIALYAHGDDYHEVLRRRLEPLAEKIRACKLPDGSYAEARICIDTAPLRERYWAVRAGLGFTGLNNQLIIPGAGSRFFLAFVLTTLELKPDLPCTLTCLKCGKCVAACPGKALGSNGEFDASKCLSYLTIEHRGDFPEDTDLHGHLYGCDVCQNVCPHNNPPLCTASPEVLPEFNLRPQYLELNASAAAKLTQEKFSTIFSHSAIKRTKLAGLLRNANQILNQK